MEAFNVVEGGLEETPAATEVVEETTESTAKPVEGFDPSTMDNYVELMNLEARKQYLSEEVENHTKKVREFDQYLKGSVDPGDVIDKNLESVSTLEELQEKTKTPEGLNWFYTNHETGEPILIANAIEDAEEFKKAYLVLCLNNRISLDGIEEEQKKLDEAMNEFNEESETAYNALTDNVSAYTNYLRMTMDPNDPHYKEKVRECDYIDASYNLSVLNEVLDNYPSVIKNTLYDMNNERRIKEVGKRYTDKLRRFHKNVSLYAMIAEDPKNSIEYLCLKPDQYVTGQENLFVFACIRYFAMADWTDSAIVKFHASLIVMLRKLKKNDFPDDMRESIQQHIADYLARFQ